MFCVIFGGDRYTRKENHVNMNYAVGARIAAQQCCWELVVFRRMRNDKQHTETILYHTFDMNPENGGNNFLRNVRN